MEDTFKVIKRVELKELLEAYHILAALECGGVDNWTWYGDSRREYLNRWACETGRDEDCYWTFEDIAEDELENYDNLEEE